MTTASTQTEVNVIQDKTIKMDSISYLSELQLNTSMRCSNRKIREKYNMKGEKKIGVNLET